MLVKLRSLFVLPEYAVNLSAKVTFATIIFIFALLFRFAHRQDLAPLLARGAQDFAGITAIHNDTAALITAKGVREALFPSSWPNKRDTSLIHYPPGYPLLLATVYSLLGRDPALIQLVQMSLDAVACVLVFFIALEFFNPTVAFLSGLAVAISHHLGYYSLLLLPDAIVPTFVVIGTYFVVIGCRKLLSKYFVLAGIFFGLACMFRASGMLIWLFWAVALLLLFGKKAFKQTLLLAVCSCLVIAPVTVRNYLIYGEFIPLSLGVGVALQEGIGEADPATGLPAKDEETMLWEAKLYGKPEYSNGLMNPDGIFREKERTRRSLEIIFSRPFWYLGVMIDRFILLTKYSAHAPLVSGKPSGSGLDVLRPLIRLVQRVFKETLLVGILIGLLLVPMEGRVFGLLLPVPLYYLLMHLPMHAEFRYALPAHYFIFIFYAVGLYATFWVLPRSLRRSASLPTYADRVDARYFEKMQPPAVADMIQPGSKKRLVIAGIGVDNLTADEVMAEIDRLVASRSVAMMTVVNASKIVLAHKDEQLRRIIESSHIVTADGMSVVWASRLFGPGLKERVTGVDTFERLLVLAEQRGYSLYLLGAMPQVIECLVDKLRKRHPGLRIVGSSDGYFADSDKVIAEIKSLQPDILVVAMGSPRQEKWLAANLHLLGVPFCIGVGGSFDHLAGFRSRAPNWMQRLGLEWLYRLLCEPKRLWKRYLLGNPYFVYLVFKYRNRSK
ncbi:MAG: WecB/TagA/CpsF family glycosyltransferase [Acidobacteriota bacterium]|nr:WecB/TagA/CpsF family glycosyltransferase [Blastocatellia bacterium]MDW8412979.1 WecB/TagA/CpsF family glycosyltransferase [Acidobacteriota bacterium]